MSNEETAMALRMHNVQLDRANRLESTLDAVRRAIDSLTHEDFCCNDGCLNPYHSKCPGCDCRIGDVQLMLRELTHK